MKTNLKKILCSLLVIAPVTLAATSLTSCNYETKVTNHNVTSVKTLALDTFVSNFDEINFKNLKATNKVEIKVVAEIDHKNYEMKVNTSSNTLNKVVVGLHVSNANLHLENNTQATLHETVLIDNKIIDTKNIDVLISQQSFPVNFVEFTISDQTIKAGQKTAIGEFTSSYKDAGQFVFIHDQKHISLENNSDNQIFIDLANCDHEQIMTGYIENVHNGKSYVSNNITITVEKTDTAATFKKIEAPKGKAGSEIAIGTFETKFGSLKDITEAKLVTKDKPEIKVEIDAAGKATIKTDESAEGGTLEGTLSAKVENQVQSFGDLTITVEKTDTTATFKKIEAPKGKAGSEIAIGTFETKFGTLKDITEAKLVTKDKPEIKVEIDAAGKATIKTDESAETSTLEGTLSAKVENQVQSFGDLTITVEKTDTAATFKKIEAPKGKAGSEIAIGTFETKFGTLKDITEAKLVTKDKPEIKVEIDAAGKATIKTDESAETSTLEGTLSAKVEDRDQTFGDLTITVEKTDSYASFSVAEKLEAVSGTTFEIGKIISKFGTLDDLKLTNAQLISDSGKKIDLIIGTKGELSLKTEKSDTNYEILVITVTVNIRGHASPLSDNSFTIKITAAI